MKNLCTADVFAAARIIRASGMREELKRELLKISSLDDPNIADVGIDSVLMFIEALAERKSEAAIYEFLANPFEMTAQEVSELGIDEFVDNLKQLAKENDLKRFFGYLSGILGKKS